MYCLIFRFSVMFIIYLHSRNRKTFLIWECCRQPRLLRQFVRIMLYRGFWLSGNREFLWKHISPWWRSVAGGLSLRLTISRGGGEWGATSHGEVGLGLRAHPRVEFRIFSSTNWWWNQQYHRGVPAHGNQAIKANQPILSFNIAGFKPDWIKHKESIQGLK